MTSRPVNDRITALLRREKALSTFGTLAFREENLQTILDEAARVCADCLGVPFSKICRYRPEENDLLVVAGFGWSEDVVGYAISVADESSPQGRAFITREPQFCGNVVAANTYKLPAFYPGHNILSTVDVIVAAKVGPPFGILEVDSAVADAFDEQDIDFLTGFANILAEAVSTSERAETLRKTISRMEQLIDEKETLSQELKHRVRNSLHLVYGLLSAELENERDEVSVEAVRLIAARVMGLAQVFDHLLGKGLSKIIDLAAYVVELCDNLANLYNQKQVQLFCTATPLNLPLDHATAIGIIITELVNNAYLHAFPNDVDGRVSVSLTIDEGNGVLKVADDGIGFVEVGTARKGMVLVRRLVNQLQGVLTVQSRAGTTWTMVWQINEAEP